MAVSDKEGYSKYIRLVSVVIDLMVINLMVPAVFMGLGLNITHFLLYMNAAWAVISYFSGFYEVYRYTPLIKVVAKIVRQYIIFFITVVAFFPFAKKATFSTEAIALYFGISYILIALLKAAMFYYLKKYRIATGSNYRNVIVIGHSDQAVRMKSFFDEMPGYGYRFQGFFSDRRQHPDVKGHISEVKDFVLKNETDEIYCSISELTNAQLKNLVSFSDDNNITIKFIPDSKEIFSKNLRIDYYEMFPVLSLRKTALHEPLAQVVKRLFDIGFSLFVIVFLLSWLIPILGLLIKLESRGPIFFKQSRPGINEKEFFCYKFRSMQLNETTEKSVTRNDPRVTRIGKFIRKTSVDELPQFFNVLRGDMSIVGPRPHLWTQNSHYGIRIKKYMMRLYVKPGITGLAQVKGCRGEITNDEDMISRIKYDIFYLENWSMLLDVKIIIQTVVNIFMGEEKAY